jgi:hypothetical protein
MFCKTAVENSIFYIDVLVVFVVLWCFTELIGVKKLELNFVLFDMFDYLDDNTLHKIIAVFSVYEMHA